MHIYIYIYIKIYVHQNTCKNSYKEKSLINSSVVYVNLSNTYSSFSQRFFSIINDTSTFTTLLFLPYQQTHRILEPVKG